jgi:O-succinylbenzoic acid--CoA ligase
VDAAVNWESDESHLFVNPARREIDSLSIEKLPQLPGHIWLATSGTSARGDELKLVALSKKAFLASAASVNQHLDATSADSWFVALPHFHVGGLSIAARAHLSGSRVEHWSGILQKWNPEQFYRDLSRSNCSLLSLVPTQLWDLVNLQKRAPAFLRAAVVGGGALHADLYRRSRDLGWPVLPSYGLTECCSQVATAVLDSLRANGSPRLQILSHLDARTDENGRLSLRSESLLTGFAIGTADRVRFTDPKIDGWFRTDDLAEICDRHLSFRGRGDDLVKISGEIVSQLALQNILERLIAEMEEPVEACVISIPDERREHRIALAIAAPDDSLGAAILEKFNREVLPHEKARNCFLVPRIPRTELGKVKRDELLRLVAQL